MRKSYSILVGAVLMGFGSLALAGSGGDLTAVANTVTKQANAVASLLSILSYVAGIGFAMAGILQFKAHKENPQQVPLSKPVVMIIVAACLLFLPAVLTTAGASIFGSSAQSAAAAASSTGGTALGGQ